MERDEQTQILKSIFAAPAEATESRQWQWARPQVEGLGPSARGGHSATLVGSRIFVFGGHRFGGDEAVYFNDCQVLDVDANQWKELRAKGTAPSPRYGHSATLVGPRVILFGGVGQGAFLRDLHALDTTTSTWYQGPCSGGAPAARYGHTACLHKTKLLVFGGQGATTFGDLHILDLGCMAWNAPETTGPKPGPRQGHAALMVQDHMIVHGGFYLPKTTKPTSFTSGKLLDDAYLNDLRVLDVNSFVWSRMRTHGAPPPGRFGHSLALSGEDLIAFGGWHGSPRFEAPSASGDEETVCKYCWVLATGEMAWSPVRFGGAPPSDRYGHTTTMVGPHAIVFGGWDGGKPLNDLIVLRDRAATDTAAPEAEG